MKIIFLTKKKEKSIIDSMVTVNLLYLRAGVSPESRFDDAERFGNCSADIMLKVLGYKGATNMLDLLQEVIEKNRITNYEKLKAKIEEE